MQGFIRSFPENSILCKQGDKSSEIYYLLSGKLLICTTVGTQVKALARISAGEFVGELSFFDGAPRASHIITLEECEVASFSKDEIYAHLPVWYKEIHRSLTNKIRFLDKIIEENAIRKSSSEEHKPLNIEEQRKILSLLTK